MKIILGFVLPRVADVGNEDFLVLEKRDDGGGPGHVVDQGLLVPHPFVDLQEPSDERRLVVPALVLLPFGHHLVEVLGHKVGDLRAFQRNITISERNISWHFDNLAPREKS